MEKSFTARLKITSRKVFLPVTPIKVLRLLVFSGGAITINAFATGTRSWLTPLAVVAGVVGLAVGVGFNYLLDVADKRNAARWADIDSMRATQAARDQRLQEDLLTLYDQWAQAQRAQGKEPSAKDYLGR